jgi:hypothetical protein
MKHNRFAVPNVVLLIGASFALTNCSSQSPLAPPSGSLVTAASDTQSARGTPFRAPSASPLVSRNTNTNTLYVTDNGPGNVQLFANGTWSPTGTISNGVSSPTGDWIDTQGNLYVANSGPYNGTFDVQEYAPNTSSPDFTYSSGLANAFPTAVATDRSGHVFVATSEGTFYPGGVVEYNQGQNAVLYSCVATHGPVEGVAVDKNNDVFINGTGAYSFEGSILEYKGGLNGCHASTLSVRLLSAGGMAVDAKSRLVVCDPRAQSVDIIPPPYSTVFKYLGSGYVNPVSVSLNRKNGKAFVADKGAGTVDILRYPHGKHIATLSGFGVPLGAVDSPNAVY